MDGMNIADFIDPDIEELLDRLEAEEIEQLQELENQMEVCCLLSCAHYEFESKYFPFFFFFGRN